MPIPGNKTVKGISSEGKKVEPAQKFPFPTEKPQDAEDCAASNPYIFPFEKDYGICAEKFGGDFFFGFMTLKGKEGKLFSPIDPFEPVDRSRTKRAGVIEENVVFTQQSPWEEIFLTHQTLWQAQALLPQKTGRCRF